MRRVEPKVARFRLKELKPAEDNPRVINDKKGLFVRKE